MMGPHHAACGAAAWVALTTRVHFDLSAATAPLGTARIIRGTTTGISVSTCIDCSPSS